MKPFPPTLREKTRYLVFEITGEKKFGEADVHKAVLSNVFGNLGVFGAAEADFGFMRFDEKTQKGLLKCSNHSIERLRASLCLLKAINAYKAFVRITNISGTIKKATDSERD